MAALAKEAPAVLRSSWVPVSTTQKRVARLVGLSLLRAHTTRSYMEIGMWRITRYEQRWRGDSASGILCVEHLTESDVVFAFEATP